MRSVSFLCLSFVIQLNVDSAFTHSIPVAGAACSSDADCSLNGVCTTGECVCASSWSGPGCVELSIGRTNLSSGLFDRDSRGVHLSTWGGSVLVDDDGVYHMWAARMTANCGIASWLSNSEIVHATSSTGPTGAFTTDSVVWPIWAHEPTVVRAPTGEFVMYWTGNNASGVLPVNGGKVCTGCTDGSTNHTVCETGRNWSVPLLTYMSWAAAPAGPWAAPVLIPARVPQIDTNMAGVILRNGSFVGLWRDNDGRFPGPSTLHRVVAADWRRPETYDEDTVAQLGEEDPTVWLDAAGNFHVLTHAGVFMKHGFSADGGYSWAYSGGTSFGGALALTNGSSLGVSRRERPHAVVDAAGRLVAVTNAFQPRGALAGASGDATFTVAVPVPSCAKV
jgi:hypothetical protein